MSPIYGAAFGQSCIGLVEQRTAILHMQEKKTKWKRTYTDAEINKK